MSTLTRQQTYQHVRTWCGHSLYLDQGTYDECHRTGRDFWCPVCGKRNSWSETSELAKAKAKVDRLETRVGLAERATARQREIALHERRSAAAHKGHLTRVKNRIANGVCPCCNRSFTPLADHMASEHPDFVVPT